MNDTTNTTNDRWDVQSQEPTKRSGVPGWVWGCGGGCLLLLVIVIGGTVWFFTQLRDAFGPEATWPTIAKIMPYGEVGPDGVQIDDTQGRPTDITVAQFPMDNELITMMIPDEALAKIPLSTIIILQPDATTARPVGTGVNATIFVFKNRLEGDPIEFTLASDFFKRLVASQIAEQSRGALELEFQGRAVHTHHLAVDPTKEEANPILPNSEGSEGLLFVDISGDRDRSIVLLCTSTGEADATMEELEAFLAPFHVWEGK